MKTLIVSLIAVFFAQAAHAQCCEQKPACPKVRTKVVTKVVEKIVEKPIIVEQERVQVVKQAVPVVVTKTVTVYKKVQKKNRVSLLGGSGPTKVVVTPSDVRLERGALGRCDIEQTPSERYPPSSKRPHIFVPHPIYF